jgi:hypothetical protein
MPNWTPVSNYTRKNYLPLSKRVDDEDYDSDEEMVGRTLANPILIDDSSSASDSDSDVAMTPPPRNLYAWMYTPAPVAPVVAPAPPVQPAPEQELCWMCGDRCHFIVTLRDDVAPASLAPLPVAPASSLPRLESMDEVLMNIDEYFN